MKPESSKMLTDVAVRVHALAHAGEPSPAQTTYLVWFQPNDRAPQNAGELKVGKDENGEMKTTTPYKDFRVLFTGEQAPHPQMPMGPEVLSSKVETP